MSTKQKVFFAFMVLFLTTSLVTLLTWVHYATEVDVQRRAQDTLEARKKAVESVRNQLQPILAGTPDSLEARVTAEATRAEEARRLVYEDTQDSRHRLFMDKGRELEAKWGKLGAGGAFEPGAAGKAWQETFETWKRENEAIQKAYEGLRNQEQLVVKQVDDGESELKNQLEDEERQRREALTKREGWKKELAVARREAEDTQDKIVKVIRDLEKKPETEKDGEIVYADDAMQLVTVDIGWEHGAKKGLRFNVYSNRHYPVPVRKGVIELGEVRATSSDANVIRVPAVVMHDPNTGWQAPDPSMRYSPLSTADAAGSEPQRLERFRSRREILTDMQREKARAERGGEKEAPGETGVVTTPPFDLGKGFEPITAGDWISNTEFKRLIPALAFQRAEVDEILSPAMREVPSGSLTFCFTDLVKSYRREFLRRLCERNRCQVAPAMSSDVDYVVSAADSTRIDLVKDRLRDIPEDKRANEAELPPDVLARVRTLKSLEDAKKFGSRVISEDQLERLFALRQRKGELLQGQVIQPGQFTFYVVGETRLRSVEETGRWIQEHGGVVAQRLDSRVDYLVVGGGLVDAKWDKATQKIYYAGQQAPATAVPFYDAVRSMGLKVLREEEVPAFFGRQ